MRTLPYTRRNIMAGQALVWGLTLAGVAAAALVAVYNLGQVALARTRLTHAADAAAYSAAVVQARSLNMLAHVQRTQIAHQVAIAHLVTLGAWAQFADTQSQRYRRGNPPGYIIGRFYGLRHRSAYAAARPMAGSFRTGLDNALDGHQRLSHDVLDSVARQLVQGLPGVRAAAVEQVLAANLPGLRISRDVGAGDVVYSINNDTWPVLLTSFAQGGGKAGTHLRHAVQRATNAYGFLDKRNRSAYNLFPSQPYCPWLRHVLRRRGDTRMDERGRWLAVDTQSFHALRGNRYIGCYFREYAMGWAMKRPSTRAAPYDPPQGVPDNFSEEHFWKWARRVARWNLLIPDNRVGNFRAARDAWISGQQGLPRGFDIAQRHRDASFELHLRQAGRSATTTEGRSVVRLSMGRFAHSVLGMAGSVQASAAAQTYFNPPKGRPKHASVWRPYWQARLIAMPRSAGRMRIRDRRMAGQALVEACLVLLLLGVTLMALARVGDTLADTQHDDHASRLHAFAAHSEDRGMTRATALRREPGGEGAAVKEMRLSWRYADRGAVVARVGARTSAVLRDEGVRHDDQATQQALGRSSEAWNSVSQSSLLLARRIDARNRPIDHPWGREAISFDWLDRWAHVDVRRRRAAARRVGIGMGCPWDMLLGADVSRRSTPRPGAGSGSGFQSSRLQALVRAKQLAHRLDGLDGLGSPTESSSGRAESVLWNGIPLAHRTFVQRGRLNDLVHLARRHLPALRDLVVGETGVALTGRDASDLDTHWLLRWTFEPEDDTVKATLSLLDLGAPQLDTHPPDWLPPETRTWRHDVREGQASAVWCGNGHAAALQESAIATLLSHGFDVTAAGQSHSGQKAPFSEWRRGRCRATLQVLPAIDTPCDGQGALWMALQDEPS